jgi:hypothetical protein
MSGKVDALLLDGGPNVVFKDVVVNLVSNFSGKQQKWGGGMLTYGLDGGVIVDFHLVSVW